MQINEKADIFYIIFLIHNEKNLKFRFEGLSIELLKLVYFFTQI